MCNPDPAVSIAIYRMECRPSLSGFMRDDLYSVASCFPTGLV